MEKLSTKLSLLIVFVVTLTAFIGCTKEDEGGIPADISVEESAPNFRLTSPKGFTVANSEEEIQKSISYINDVSVDSIEIFDVEFMETEAASAAFILYKIKGEDLIKNVAVGKGKIEFSTESLQVDSRNAEDIKTNGTSSAKISGSAEMLAGPTVSCSGCANCRVGGRIDPDGTIHFQCESSCCVMTISY